MPLASPFLLLHAQQPVSNVATTINGRVPVAATVPTAVPALVPFSAAAVDSKGKQLSGEASVTFLIYKDQQGGEPVFTESQMVAFDESGRYKVQLGAANPQGLPTDLFSSGEARWLEVQISGQSTEPRILLASVPYALKAADAATLGGLPASAFVLAGNNVIAGAGPAAITPAATSTVTTTGGTTNKVAKFSGTNTIVNSVIYDNGTEVGVGTTSPTATLTVTGTFTLNGASTFNGAMNLNPLAAATASAGQDSQQIKIYASAYNSSSKAAVTPHFIFQTEPTGNNTTSPGGTLNLLASPNSGGSVETGLYFNTNGTIHFAPSQTFPAGTGGSGTGTITGVTAGTGLTGGGTSGKVTLNVNTAVIPTLTGNNTFTGTETLTASMNEANDINIDNQNKNAGNVSPGLRFGNASGEGISSQRTSSGNSNQYGLDFYTDYSRRLSIYPGGEIEIGDLDVLSGPPSATLYIQPFQTDSEVFYTAGQGGSCVIDTDGNLSCAGNIYGASKNFKIDDPIDPANKYLVHASVESSEMLNIYSGNVTTDGSGSATVTLPEWFAAENGDFRYQLTTIGQDAHAWIAQEVTGRTFKVATNATNVKVSWQITAIRQDGYAKAHPMIVEQEKVGKEHGLYQHPELFGQPMEKGISWSRRSTRTSESKTLLGVANPSIGGGSTR